MTVPVTTVQWRTDGDVSSRNWPAPDGAGLSVIWGVPLPTGNVLCESDN